MKKLAILTLTALLASCAQTQRPSTPDRVIDRALRSAPGTAQPSKIVATELAFARMAREKGQWTAFAEFAADGGLLFGRNGAVEAKPFVKALDNPPEAVQWEPYQVWMSCDATIGVTTGGFADPEGSVGRFNTVWERQRNGEYKYRFDFGIPLEAALDKPDLIGSEIGNCNTPTEWRADLPADARYSRDGSLAWRFELVGEGTREYQVWLAGEEGYDSVIEIALPPAAQ